MCGIGVRENKYDHTNLVVQDIVLRLHTSHEGVLGQVICRAGVLLIGPLHLLVQRLDIGRQKAAQLEGLSLVVGEGRAFIVVRVMKKRGSLDGSLLASDASRCGCGLELTSWGHSTGPYAARGKWLNLEGLILWCRNRKSWRGADERWW